MFDAAGRSARQSVRRRPTRLRSLPTPTPRKRSNGRTARRRASFPRLKFGGAHLEGSCAATSYPMSCAEQWARSAWRRSLWIVLTMLIAAWLAGARNSDFGHTLSAIIHGETEVPWRAMLLTAESSLAVAVPLALLSGRYHVMGTDKVGQDVFYQALEEHPHRPRHRHADDARDAAVCDSARDHGRLLPRPGWTMSSSTSTPR